MDTAAEPWEIARDLTRKEYKTLAAIRGAGGEASTGDVTSSDPDLYNTLVNSHFRQMCDADLLERLEPEGDDPEAEVYRSGYIYRITDRGSEVLSMAQEDYNMTALEEGAVRERFDRIEGRLESVEQEIEEQSEGGGGSGDLEAQVAALEERVETIEENQEAMLDDLRKVADFLEETREEVGLGGFWENNQT